MDPALFQTDMRNIRTKNWSEEVRSISDYSLKNIRFVVVQSYKQGSISRSIYNESKIQLLP